VGRLLACAGILALGLTALGCQPEADLLELPPVPSDLQEVAAQYDAPTGTVPADAQAQIDEVAREIDLLRETAFVDYITQRLVGVRERLEESGISTGPDDHPYIDRTTLNATARLDRTCRGWDDASTTPDPANGAVQLFAKVESNNLTRLLWGTASACRDIVPVTDSVAVHPYFDGSVAIYLEGPLPTSLGDAHFIVALDGTLGTERLGNTAVSFDFRFDSPQLEVRVPVSDGVIIGSGGLNEISLRGTNGTFGCSRETHVCGQL
jgi:hypothetical protein